METLVERRCDVCDCRHIVVLATTWCPDCHEALCASCQEHHDALKITSDHKTISMNDLNKLPPFVTQTSKLCEEHNKMYELYCSFHQKCCCLLCWKEQHSQCKELDILCDVVKNVKTSSKIDDIEKCLQDIISNLDKLIVNREENKSRIQEQQQIYLRDIKKIRNSINEHLDRLEMTLIQELSSTTEDILTKQEITLKDLTNHKEKTVNLQSQLITAKQFATDVQMFLGFNSLEGCVEQKTTLLESMSQENAFDEVDLHMDLFSELETFCSDVTSFGKISLSSNPIAFDLSFTKKEQAQFLMYSKDKLTSVSALEILTFSLQGENDELKVKVNGCTMIPGKQMIFTDFESNQVIICSDDGKAMRKIPTRCSPCGIAFIEDTTISVTLPNAKTVVFLELLTGKELSSFCTNAECYGIDYSNEKLFIRIARFFLITKLSGETIMKIEADCPTYLSVAGEKIFATKKGDHSVFCYKHSGELEWKFEAANLRGPCDLTTDTKGNVYVSGEESKNIVIISPNGKTCKEIVSGLGNPRALHFENSLGLLLSCQYDGTATLYSIK